MSFSSAVCGFGHVRLYTYMYIQEYQGMTVCAGIEGFGDLAKCLPSATCTRNAQENVRWNAES